MLSYLDQLDSNCDKTIEEVKMMKLPDSARSEIDFTAEPYDFIEDVPKYVLHYSNLFSLA